MTMIPISFMTANFVARQVGYNMREGWGQGDKATNAYFQPLETFGERFEELLQDVAAMGFEFIDIWEAHLHPNWATAEHIAMARDLLAKYGFSVSSLAGWMGSTAGEFEARCRLAAALNCPVLGGSTSLLSKDRTFTIAKLQEYDLKLGIENHPGTSGTADILALIGNDAQGRIGATVDTGWFATYGFDAALAIAELHPYVFHVHLKDVLAPTKPEDHRTVRYGQGIVPLERCVQVLQEMGYDGGISVEHEPGLSDPTEDVVASLAMLEGWLGNGRS
jgi:sugar phosphate isomerase/epimerase